MSGPAANPLEMSDEDFLKMNSPEAAEPAQEEQEEEQQGEAEGEEQADPAPTEDEGDEGKGEEAGEQDPAPETETDETSEVETPGAEKPVDGDTAVERKANDPAAEKAAESNEAPDYEALYKQIMAPFKANGKTFTPQSVEEVIQLAQMGANYTKKLQDIQPHRKVLLMLQNNDLLDEGKLSYLIDLDKKDPAAIKKLIKDAGIDPLDIDTESEPDYTAGNHKVSDEEARFHEVLGEITSSDTGKETVAHINKNWDQASKEVIWAQPDVMSVIHEQRENGIYDVITAEMDRQRTLGKIPASVPFLQAYKVVGDALSEAGALNHLTQPKGNSPVEPRPIAQRAVKPKPKVVNGDKAKAAVNTQQSSSSSKPIVNPLAMSDEEFMKLDPLKSRL